MSWYDPSTWGLGGDIAGFALLGLPVSSLTSAFSGSGFSGLEAQADAAAKADNAAKEDLTHDRNNDAFSAAFDALRSRSYLDSMGRRGYRDTYLIGPRGTEGGYWPRAAPTNWGALDLPRWIQYGGTPRPEPTTGTGPAPRPVPPTQDPTSGVPGVDNNPNGATPEIEPLDLEPLDVWVGRPPGQGRQRR